MKYTNSENLPKDFFKTFYEIATMIDNQTAQIYADNAAVPAGGLRNSYKTLFTFRDCVISYSGNDPYSRYEWCCFNYDGAEDSDNRHLCGFANTMAEIIDDILDRMD